MDHFTCLLGEIGDREADTGVKAVRQLIVPGDERTGANVPIPQTQMSSVPGQF